MDAPPLATTSPESTSRDQAGVIGQPTTTILFGGGLNDQVRPGGRFTLGTALDPCGCRELAVTYVALGEARSSFAGSNDEFPILARPFFNAQNNAQDSRLIAFPGDVSGNLAIEASTEFQAFEAAYRVSVDNSCCRNLEVSVGYRFAQLDDGVAIREFTQALSGPVAGTTFDLTDDFTSRNSFHGGQLGLRIFRQRCDGWSWDAAAKFALGSTRTAGTVSGRTTTTTGGASATTEAGLLAQATNIGRFDDSTFATLSEIDFTVRRQLDCGISLVWGYSLLYWSDAARAGDQIDFTVNPSQIPPGTLTGPARPAVPLAQSGFWAQGLRFGVEYLY